MYTSLLIVKKQAFAWMYYPNGLTTGFAVSKGYITGDEVTGLMQIVEQGKTKRPEVLITNIIVRDEFSGGANLTFTNFADLQQQLVLMGNPLMVETIGGTTLNPEDNRFLSKPGFDLVGNTLTVRPNWIWKLVGITYTNPLPVPFVIPYAASGMTRFEYIIPNNANGFTRVVGLESAGIPIVPSIPDNGLYVTFYQVTDNEVVSPQQPIDGTAFVKKVESQDFITSYGATTVIDTVLLIDDRSSISLTGAITDVKSLQIDGLYQRVGKPIFIKNRTGHDVKLWNNAGAGNTKLLFYNGLDLIVKNNSVIQFNLNANDTNNLKAEFVGIIVDDSNIMHLTGNETFIGIKSSTNTGATQINGLSLINNGTSGSQVLNISNTNTGTGARFTNSATSGTALSVYNTNSGVGQYVENQAGGIGLSMANGGAGNLITINSVTASTGDLLRFNKNNVLTCKIDQNGLFSATNTGATSTTGIALTNSGTSGTHSMFVTNTSTGRGFGLNNNSTGIGLIINNSGNGSGIYINNSGNGLGFTADNQGIGATMNLNSATASIGDLLRFQKNGILTSKFDQNGILTTPSPIFTGTPTAPTAAQGTNTTQIATTAFVLANAGTGASYTSTGTAGTNVTSPISTGANYTKVGSFIDVCIRFTITVTSFNLASAFDFSIPSFTIFETSGTKVGIGVIDFAATDQKPAIVSISSTSGRVTISFISSALAGGSAQGFIQFRISA